MVGLLHVDRWYCTGLREMNGSLVVAGIEGERHSLTVLTLTQSGGGFSASRLDPGI